MAFPMIDPESVSACTNIALDVTKLVCAYANDIVGAYLFAAGGPASRMAELCRDYPLDSVKSYASAFLVDAQRLDSGATLAKLGRVLEAGIAAGMACSGGRADTLAWLVASFALDSRDPERWAGAASAWQVEAWGGVCWPLAWRAWGERESPTLVHAATAAAIANDCFDSLE